MRQGHKQMKEKDSQPRITLEREHLYYRMTHVFVPLMYAFKIRERKHFEVEAQFSSSQIRSIFIFDEVSREVLRQKCQL